MTPAVARAGMAVAWYAGVTCAFRGGSWNYTASGARATNRYGFSSGTRLDGLGFRLCRELLCEPADTPTGGKQ